MAKKQNHYVHYSGPGTYTPHIHYGTVEWRRDTTGNPMFGVNIDNIKAAIKLGTLARIESEQEQES